MLVGLALFAGFVALLLFQGWAAVESRPAFLDPREKQPPFLTPFRLDEDRNTL